MKQDVHPSPLPAAPLVSVIIPVLNGVRTLGDCLQSLIRQTFRSFEVVLVDGNSTDGSQELAKRLLTESHITFVLESKPDSGVYEAMNRGIELAKGEWLYFLGSDDQLFSPTALEEIEPHLKEAGMDLLLARVTTDEQPASGAKAVDVHYFKKSNVCHQGILYRRKLFRALGNYNPRYRVYADWDFNFRCMVAGVPYKSVPQTVARYSRGGLSSRVGDPLFHREMGLLESQYRFRFSKGLSRWKWFPVVMWKSFRLALGTRVTGKLQPYLEKWKS